MSVFTKRTRVTPAQAAKWLEKNTINRNLSAATVDRYAADMRSGSWIFNHQGIAFDDQGRLIDGQHRLNAIVSSGATVEMLVTTGLPNEVQNGVLINTMDTVDRLRLRRVGEQLQLRHGYKQGNLVAASAKICAEICNDGSVGSLSTAQTLKVLDIYGKAIVEVIHEVQTSADRKASIIGALAFHRVGNPEQSYRFASQFFSGENLSAQHPALALRKWIGNNPNATGSGMNRYGFLKVVAAAIHAASENRKLAKAGQSSSAIAWLRAQQKSNVRKVLDIIAGEKAK